MNHPRRTLGRSLALLCLFLCASTSFAADWPSGPVKLVVGFTPGGPPDIIARVLARKLAGSTGQPFIVENKPGASGTIGGNAVARATPDGLTLLLGSSTFSAVNALYEKLPFDVDKDLAPVAMIGQTPLVLVVNTNLSVQSVADLVKLAETAAPNLTVASPGTGTTPHLAAEQFQQGASVKLVHVPYKGSAPAMTDLLGGQVDLMFENALTALPHIKSGKLRALAVTSATRYSDLPSVPTMAESGLPDSAVAVWFGIFAPAKTTTTILIDINTANNEALRTPDVQAELSKLGLSVAVQSREAFAALWREDEKRFVKLIKERDIRLDR